MYHSNHSHLRVPATDYSEVKEYKPTNGGINQFAYEVHKGFRNFLSYPVVLIDRNNFAVQIPSQQSSTTTDRELQAVVTLSFCSDVLLDVHHILDELSDNSPKELHVLKEAIQNNNVQITYGRRSIQFIYAVNDIMLQRNRYEVYVPQLDYVVCRSGHSANVVHPFSTKGKAITVVDDISGFTYRIIINDPHHDFGTRWVNINGKVLQVPVTHDRTTKPGVYVYTNAKTELDADYYSFEEAENKVPLYANSSLAVTYGKSADNAKAMLENKTIEHKQELANREQELAKLKAEFAEQELALKKQAQQFALEVEMQKAEARKAEADMKRIAALENQRINELKYDLEYRSANRKDTSEFLKWLPAVVAAGAALFGIFS